MLYYFAYGSNMLHERLQRRVSSANPMGVAKLGGYRLAFRKRSMDGSAKCDLVSDTASEAYGVLFEMKEEELPFLDRAEGVGFGYERVERQLYYRTREIGAFLYLAQPRYITTTDLPYSWYLQFVLHGAKQNALPPAYIQRIASTPRKEDDDIERVQRNHDILREANIES